MTQILTVGENLDGRLNESLFGLETLQNTKPVRAHTTHTHTHIIEEAGFLSLLLSNRGSYRAKSPWWQADVELGGVGGKKGNLWERCVSSRRRRRRRRCSGVHLLFLDVVNLSVYVPHKLSELFFFFCLSAVCSQIYRCI